ncbi:hypothetical protein PL263_17885 [Methylomonas sp. EFPC3]|uniref:hypothetical protein n=1 Tax=Methylomonas sp. EFPC3 TaxID=3021710 RepID=UPI002415B85F|nr:hypothetical protein [Methylomonas sp. EFPC3]WFP49958.1 hypothetical protein PL263_17885 [Methylomonas sp. EFPC3]
MAYPIYTVQLAGFTAGGIPSNGTGLIAAKTITIYDDGAIGFTNAAGQPKKMADNPEFNALLVQLIQGANAPGNLNAKKFHQA